MNSHHDRYFFISGFISISLFLLILLLAGYAVRNSAKIEQFAMVQSDTISVSIALSEEKGQIEPAAETAEPPSEPEPAPVPPEKKSAEKSPEISDLFSQVKPRIEPQKNADRTKRYEGLAALEKELTASAEKQRFSEKVKNIELSKPGLKMVVQGGSAGPVVNEYHAKIQGLIYTHFHPPAGSAGQAARVRIKISPGGKLVSYKIIAYSASTSLNNEVDWLKERLGTVVFPPHPEGREAVLECILTAKE